MLIKQISSEVLILNEKLRKILTNIQDESIKALEKSKPKFEELLLLMYDEFISKMQNLNKSDEKGKKWNKILKMLDLFESFLIETSNEKVKILLQNS